jgi:hypothetical protein
VGAASRAEIVARHNELHCADSKTPADADGLRRVWECKGVGFHVSTCVQRDQRQPS